jgi:outer membrane immunogenic protein
MKNLILASTLLLTITGLAQAADMPLKAPPPPAWSWSGCYIGGTVGGYRSSSTYNGVPTGDFNLPFESAVIPVLTSISSGTFDQSGVIGGGELGCNWQAGIFVFGLEGDVSGWHNSSTSTVTGPDVLAPGQVFHATTSVTSNTLATGRPRIGIAANNWLFYATGGLAVANAAFSQSVFFTATRSTQAGATSTSVGWTAGGGIEYAITPNWTVKGEYLYVSLDSQTMTENNVAFPTFAQSATNKLAVSIGRFGVNYKF